MPEQSFRRLILDLQLWPKMTITAEKLLVGLSRVQMLDHLRILPFGPGQNEQHLYCLKPNQLMLHWFAGFNEAGIWSPQGAAASIQKHPLTSTKKRAATSTGSTKRQASTKSSAPPKTSSDQSSESSSVRVVSQFRLNLAHAWRANTDKLFHAFNVPGDGHCLFHSYILFLKLQTAVSELRRQTVDYIASDPNPIRRLSALNAHIAR